MAINTIVCVKQVPDSEAPASAFRIDEKRMRLVTAQGIPPIINMFDEQAVEAALRIKDAQGGKITVISMGNNLVMDVVKKPLSMGSDELVLIQDPDLEESDSFVTAQVLAAAIRKVGTFDLVLCGRQASDWDNAQVASGIAEILGIPCVTIAKAVEVSGGKVVVDRVLPDGVERVEAPLPCVVTVSNELGEPRYPTLRGIMAAGRKQPVVWKAADLNLDPGMLTPRVRIERVFIPVKESHCEFIQGETPADAGRKLALKLREGKIL